jgi:hypothetical protein
LASSWGFVTIFFLRGGVVSLTPNPQPGGPGYPFFVWVITLDLSGMGGPTSSISYCQHSSRDNLTTQASPLRQSRDTFGGNGPIYEGIFTYICSLFPSPNFFDYDLPYSDSMVLGVYPLSLSKPVPRCMPRKGRIFRPYSLCQRFPTRLIYIICKFNRPLLHPI